jgi:hypothetical protein
LATKFASEGAVEVGIDRCLNSSSRKREFSHPLNLIANTSTSAAENTFVGISLKKRRPIIRRETDWLPWVECLFYPIFIDQSLEVAFAFFFTARADHRMIEENEVKLSPSRFKNLWRLRYDLHSVSCRGETGGQELRFPSLLDNTEATSAEGDEPSVVAERGDADASGLSRLENRLSFINLNLNFINL